MARLNLPTDALARVDAQIDRQRLAVLTRGSGYIAGPIVIPPRAAADEDRGLAPMRPAASLKPQPSLPAKADVPATALRLAPLWRGW